MNILIVDDRPANLKLLRAVLEAEGTTVCEAVDGLEALGVLKRERVDAIISDILMPRMDGYRLCMEVRANGQFCDVPFIAYTATYTSARDEKLMTDMGADRFLRKPASAAVLTATLKDVIQSKRHRPPTSARSRPEADLLKAYNERLAAKLEEKTIELESKNEQLTQPAAEPCTDPRKWQRALHHALAAAFAEDSSISKINQKILATLGASLDWGFGELWLREQCAPVLHCAETWHLQTPAFHEFASERQKLTFAAGQGLPGRIWASGRTEWYSEVVKDTIPSIPLASPEGLPDWIGFPVMLRQEVAGVVGFFRRKGKPPDAELLSLFETVGLQMGQFIERQQLAEELRQAQKMAAIGTLAGGIAHDFNNILGGIYGYCELAHMEARGNLPITAHLEAVMNGARRATSLVKQILAFSRRQGQDRRPIQLRHITAEAMRLLRAAVPTTIEFLIMLASDVPVVLVDETQIHQVLMNLGTNAAHAMREHGGRLTVKLENYTIDAEQGTGQSKLSVGQYARLTVGDTGHGMDEQTLGKIYEPFYTTKPPGDGVGLGLAVVRGIVNEHKGVITVSSRCGQGTTFQVYFPAHPVVVEEVANAYPTVPRGSGERVLFVDDEPTLANLGKLVLDRCGYVTDTCSDGHQALELVQASPDAYALIITDQMMPVMTGTDLAQKLSTIRPNLPIIIATGCLDPLLPDRLRALGVRQLLCKPVSVQALALAAHQVLSAAAICEPHEHQAR